MVRYSGKYIAICHLNICLLNMDELVGYLAFLESCEMSPAYWVVVLLSWRRKVIFEGILGYGALVRVS